MDWERETQAWIDEGLIDEAQRPALLARLQATPSTHAFAEAAPVGLVGVGMLFMNASAALALVLLDVPVEGGSLVIAGLAILQAAAALLVRLVVNSAVGHGIGAASVITYGCAIAIAATTNHDAFLLLTAAGVAASAVALMLSVRDGGRGLAASAGAALVPIAFVITIDGIQHTRDHWITIFFGCLAYAVTVPAAHLIATLLERPLPRHFDVLIYPFPFASLCVAMCTWQASWQFTAAADALFGVVVLIGSRILESRLMLMTGLAVLLCAQLPVLFEINEVLVSMAIIGAEGMALMLGAIAYIVVRQAASSSGSEGRDSSTS